MPLNRKGVKYIIPFRKGMLVWLLVVTIYFAISIAFTASLWLYIHFAVRPALIRSSGGIGGRSMTLDTVTSLGAC